MCTLHCCSPNRLEVGKKVVSDSPGLVDFAIGLVNSVLTGLEIAPVSGAFANKDFAFATKISPLVAILRRFYRLAYK